MKLIIIPINIFNPPFSPTHFLGVNILHLIATPFPDVWHTLGDDASVVHLPTVEKFNKIFRIFVAEYLGLG